METLVLQTILGAPLPLKQILFQRLISQQTPYSSFQTLIIAICSTPLTDEPIHQLPLEELAENMTDGFVNIYIIGSDDNLQLVKTWRYSERNEQAGS